MSNITVLEYVVVTDVEILFLIALRPRKLFLYFANYIFYANTGESNNPKLQHISEVTSDRYLCNMLVTEDWRNTMKQFVWLPNKLFCEIKVIVQVICYVVNCQTPKLLTLSSCFSNMLERNKKLKGSSNCWTKFHCIIFMLECCHHQVCFGFSLLFLLSAWCPVAN